MSSSTAGTALAAKLAAESGGGKRRSPEAFMSIQLEKVPARSYNQMFLCFCFVGWLLTIYAYSSTPVIRRPIIQIPPPIIRSIHMPRSPESFTTLEIMISALRFKTFFCLPRINAFCWFSFLLQSTRLLILVTDNRTSDRVLG